MCVASLAGTVVPGLQALGRFAAWPELAPGTAPPRLHPWAAFAAEHLQAPGTQSSAVRSSGREAVTVVLLHRRPVRGRAAATSCSAPSHSLQVSGPGLLPHLSDTQLWGSLPTCSPQDIRLMASFRVESAQITSDHGGCLRLWPCDTWLWCWCRESGRPWLLMGLQGWVLSCGWQLNKAIMCTWSAATVPFNSKGPVCVLSHGASPACSRPGPVASSSCTPLVTFSSWTRRDPGAVPDHTFRSQLCEPAWRPLEEEPAQWGLRPPRSPTAQSQAGELNARCAHIGP